MLLADPFSNDHSASSILPEEGNLFIGRMFHKFKSNWYLTRASAFEIQKRHFSVVFCVELAFLFSLFISFVCSVSLLLISLSLQLAFRWWLVLSLCLHFSASSLAINSVIQCVCSFRYNLALPAFGVGSRVFHAPSLFSGPSTCFRLLILFFLEWNKRLTQRDEVFACSRSLNVVQSGTRNQ